MKPVKKIISLLFIVLFLTSCGATHCSSKATKRSGYIVNR